MEIFRAVIDKHVETRYTYHETYLLDTLDTLNEKTILFDITTSLLAAIATNRDVLNIWRDEYIFLNQQFSKEDYPQEYTVLVKTVCDGLWFSNLFSFHHTDQQDERKMIHYLLDRKSTRLNSSHVAISYAVFCLNK